MDPFGNFLNGFSDEYGGAQPGVPHEPPSELRYAASTLFSMYMSFVDGGFTRDEAFILVKEVLVASIAAAGGGKGDQA